MSINKLISAARAKKPTSNIKVNFLICGTQKAGTSALDLYLREHPDVCMANKKEVHFFDNQDYFRKRKPDYSYYHSFFEPTDETSLIGEVTPIYMYWNNSIKRIYEYNPDMLIIVILRNPIDRAYSHWNMERTKGNEKRNFAEVVENLIQKGSDCSQLQDRIFSYIDRGIYTKQMAKIFSFFPKQNVHVMKYEEFKKQPHIILNEMTKFLGIRNVNTNIKKQVNTISYENMMSNYDRDVLREFYKLEIKELEKMFNWDCEDWLN